MHSKLIFPIFYLHRICLFFPWLFFALGPAKCDWKVILDVPSVTFCVRLRRPPFFRAGWTPVDSGCKMRVRCTFAGHTKDPYLDADSKWDQHRAALSVFLLCRSSFGLPETLCR